LGGAPAENLLQITQRNLGGIRLTNGYASSPFFDYKSKGFKVELLGEAEVGGTPAHKVSLKTKEGITFIYYLDSKTFLPIKMETGKSATMFGDYKKVDGITTARLLELPEANLKMTIEKIEINPAIDGKRFQVPEVKKDEAKTENKDSGDK